MKSTICSIIANDDYESITVVYLTKIEVLSMNNLTLLKSHLFDFPIGFVSTHHNCDYIAVTGRVTLDVNIPSQKSAIVYETAKYSKIFEKAFDEDILSIALTGDLLALSFKDHFEVWNTEAKLLVHRIKTCINIYYPLFFSPSRKVIISGGKTTDIVGIYTNLTSMLKTIPISIGDSFSFAAFSPDSTKLAVSCGNNVIIINPNTGACSSFIRCSEIVRALCISNDSRIAALTENAVNFIDAKAVSVKKTISITKDPFVAINWVGRSVFLAAINGTAKLIKFSGSIQTDSLLR